MGLPVDADTAGLDAPPPAVGDEHAQLCSEAGGASDQSADDEFLADAELVGVKVLPFVPAGPVAHGFSLLVRGACGSAGAVRRRICAGRAGACACRTGRPRGVADISCWCVAAHARRW
eukprot:2801086-Prymnesium_polylepis.1